MKITNKWNHSPRRSLGFTILEISIALGLMSVIMAGIVWYASDSRDNVVLRNDAQKFAVLIESAKQYIEANRESLVSAGARKLVPIDTLKTEGYLDGSFESKWGKSKDQEISLMIKITNSGGKQIPQGLLVSFNGKDYSDSELGRITAAAGAASGYVPRNKNYVQGANGSWTVNVADWQIQGLKPTSGHMAALVTSGLLTSGSQDVSGFLHRKIVSGKPELNKMETNLDMKNNDLINAKVIDSANIVSTSIAVSDTLSASKLIANQLVQAGSVRASHDIEAASVKTSQVYTNEVLPVSGVLKINASRLVLGAPSVPNAIEISNNGGVDIYAGEFFHLAVKDGNGQYYPLLQTSKRSGGVGVDLVLGTRDVAQDLRLRWGTGYAARWQSESDRRKKHDISPLHGSLDNIEKISGHRYKWNRDGSSDIGFIAQEVQKIYPELVKKGSDGFLSLNYSNFTAILWEAVKELHVIVRRLEGEMSSLHQSQLEQKTKIEKLELQIHQQKIDFIKLKQQLQQPLSEFEQHLLQTTQTE
ncbi:hypothetical protein BUE93_09225 [Chromobacterium amazonense]|uniref:Peptidase S74 domain-containing protein n=1 Tax=Chromobacterium amazonense TaxID=1382803 RepID=A0A2S9X5H7_9NEIS|nr:shufflon system plasmid conjugative transfer pilus tip adhesin PilV [Chromobacterium amazonense]PRP70947.1 hypothetical protein BUE93_09225 [Chromobacterium amazonense]